MTQRTTHLLDDHPGMGEISFTHFLRSACCNVPLMLWRWEAADMYMIHCVQCREPHAAPTGEDMDRIKRDKLPRFDDTLEHLTFVDLEKGPQAFRTITIA